MMIIIITTFVKYLKFCFCYFLWLSEKDIIWKFEGQYTRK